MRSVHSLSAFELKLRVPSAGFFSVCFLTVDAWVSETFQQHSIETALILLSKATSNLLRILKALAEDWFLSIV